MNQASVRKIFYCFDFGQDDDFELSSYHIGIFVVQEMIFGPDDACLTVGKVVDHS